jgi:hypothetical protein
MRQEMKAKAGAALMIVAVGTFGLNGCTSADWATSSSSQTVLLMTGINDGRALQSDVQLSGGTVCADFVPLRLENHFKNPNVTGTGFRDDITIERYEIHYYLSDGRNTEGVDVPYAISGNLATEVQAASTATLNLEVVRAQAKLEPPLRNLAGGGGALIVTIFANIQLYARTTTGIPTNPISAVLQIDFADFATTVTTCPTS